MGLESSQAGGWARVAGWYEMRGISHVWGTWEAPLSGRRCSGSQLFNTIYSTLLDKAHVTPVMPEHVPKKSIKNNVCFWCEIKCLWVPRVCLRRWSACGVFSVSVISTHQVGMVLLVYGVGPVLRGPGKQSHVSGVCLEISLGLDSELPFLSGCLCLQRSQRHRTVWKCVSWPS